ncbi:hypothetical protein GW17_00040582 [Ensete ventricosum]|nr:hypothetical protein GW17_00040582 [Ensete ventricosum]
MGVSSSVRFYVSGISTLGRQLGLCFGWLRGEDPARRFHQGGGARRDSSDTQVSALSWFDSNIVEEFESPPFLPSGGGFIHTRRVIDRTLGLTSNDASDLVDSYGRLLCVRAEWSVAVCPDRVMQRCDTPFLINESQHGFDCRDDQAIARPPRTGLRQLGRLIDLDAIVDC